MHYLYIHPTSKKIKGKDYGFYRSNGNLLWSFDLVNRKGKWNNEGGRLEGEGMRVWGYKSSLKHLHSQILPVFIFSKICLYRHIKYGWLAYWPSVWSVQNITTRKQRTRTSCWNRRRCTICFIASLNQLWRTLHGITRVKHGT